MANYDNCIPFLLSNEGGILVDPRTGENSNFGITQKDLQAFNWYPNDPKLLTENDVKNIYYIFFWQKWNMKNIKSDIFARKVFDMIINMGPKQAALCLQRALGFGADQIDGIIGFRTIEDLNQWSEEVILPKIVEQCVDFYTKLAASDQKYAKYKDGWLRRAMRV
jgi:lysozyme family protein